VPPGFATQEFASGFCEEKPWGNELKTELNNTSQDN
jgi:hypothetical protein